ncbi:MAG TPA: 30S ribosomal protein S8 [Cellvibrionaceae bacterium]
MSMQDPVADMLTRVRNAQSVGKFSVAMPASNMKLSIAKVLQSEGYIGAIEVSDDLKKIMTLELKYFEGKPVISEVARVSRPGLRSYVAKTDLPTVRGGLGVAIISTSKGVMTDRAARAAGVGGEVICTVF